jgi:coenzyme F420-reducing hydrogenase beta subunit
MIEIKEKEKCTGCYACKNICPRNCMTMERDNEGFEYPIVNKVNCSDCGLCEKVCPMLHEVELYESPVAYAAYNKNEKIRMESSSGGLFTLIAEKILDQGGVVFGAAFDEQFNVKHSHVEIKSDLHRLRGSKYVQSRIGDAYEVAKEFLKKGRGVLFTGTPCQIVGLKFYLGKRYENLICQDIICQGVPSPLVWRKYLNFRTKQEGKISQPKNISFRSKEEGWKKYKLNINFKNGYKYQQNKEKDIYMRIFMKFLSIRPSCFQCKFKGEHRKSDITLADFWGIQNILPSMDDDKGTSLILINSVSGQKYFDKIKDDIVFMEVDFSEAIKGNPMYTKSIPYNNSRESFYNEFNHKEFYIVANKYLKEPLLTNLYTKLRKTYKKFRKLEELR